MMNLVAIALLVSSLAVAGVFSPPSGTVDTQPNPPLVREGHRLIVVEYERQIQPGASAPRSGDLVGDGADEANEKLLLDLGQPAKEKICDAYGVCKEKISDLFTKTKKKASKSEESVADALKSAAESAKVKAERLQESAVDALESAAEWTKEKTDRLQESAADALKSAEKTMKGKAEQFQELATDAIASAAESAKEKAAGVEESATGAVKSAVNSAKNATEGLSANISAAARKGADRAEAAASDLGYILRLARDLACEAAAYVVAGAGRAARSVAAMAHLLGFATAYGTCVWVTFASSHVLASALPRLQFGIVHSRLYPVYFRVMAFSVAAALAGHSLAGLWRSPADRLQGYNLLAALGMVMMNMLYFEPRATKVMFERMKMEKEEGQGRDITYGSPEGATPPGPLGSGNVPAATAPETEAAKSRMVILSKRLKKLNSYSSFLNVLVLMELSWHLVYMSYRLDSGCLAS